MEDDGGMLMSQDDSFSISQKYPCGQGSNKKSNLPKDDSETISMYLTLAKNSPNGTHIIKTLSLIKHSVTYNQNVKNLHKAGKEDLQKTLAFLMACDEKDMNITQWQVDGLRLVLMETLLKLMPVICKECDDKEPILLQPGEIPYVSCIRCDIMACPRCFSKDDAAKNNICYVCNGCDEILSK